MACLSIDVERQPYENETIKINHIFD